MISNCKKTILKIEKELAVSQNEHPFLSLFTGTGSFSLFYYMLHQYTAENLYYKKFEDSLNNLYDRLNEENFSYTYCDGLCGIAYLLNFYKRKNILRAEDIDDALLFFDDFIVNNISKQIEIKNGINEEMDDDNYLDFLHGILGGMYYLVTRVKAHKKIAKDVCKIFDQVSVHILEEMGEDHSPKLPFNCGISHGVGSIIVIYSKFLEQYPDNRKTKHLLQRCTTRLLKYKSKNPNTFSQFPSIVYNEKQIKYETPMGWCYGDQTVAFALHYASEVLNDQALKNEALAIALKTTERNTVVKASKSEKTDAGLCHGMASVAYLNKRWYQISGDERFNTQYQFFLQEVLKRGNHKDTLSGFKKFVGEDGFQEDVGFLSGSCGIGVFLIDAIAESTIQWDELLLIR